MGNTLLREHCETAKKTGVFRFTQKRLNKIPDELYKIKLLIRTLDLSDNKLMSMPGDIGEFENLKHLNFSKNQIAYIPENISQLHKLETLSVCDNEIRSLPKGLSELKHLKEVYLSGNKLSTFPLVFGGITSLDVLDLSKNCITTVPDEVSNIHAIELILNQNQISHVSEEIAKCPRLKTLRLEENCLQLNAIPTKMLSDSNISVLTLEGNLFEMKRLNQVEGYEHYMERYTATKKKMF